MTQDPHPERERGERVQELLDAIESLSAASRESYLARVCPDAELRLEVLSLLAAESEASDYLVRLAEGMVPGRAAPSDLTGKRVGAYRLLRPVGRGGMGVVYEAERADGAFERHVALKLLTTAFAGTEAHERFLAERQILAGLEHPAIAHMVDGGVTPDGTPWFAMEFVDGEAIDVYSDRRQLGIRQRLQLFLQVCDAVEHAHRRLVVHRDLKPGNVLVTEEQRVKLLDFGIAKLLGTGGDGRATPATRVARRLMTPEYASPEQVRGEPVTTASDVYQLGLLLYELLTGHRPYTLPDRGAGQLERIICEQVPPRPSTAISRETTLKLPEGIETMTVAEACRARRSSPARLRRRLRGDLDNIALKALRKEPELRYGSADRLAQDIRRHLSGLPVTARSETLVYRCGKFLQRHVAGASATAVLLVFGIGLGGIHTSRIQSERDRAQTERDRAQTEAAKAAQVGQFLAGLFAGADPLQARSHDLTARELLARGVEQVDRELADQPELQADMFQVLGRTYLELGLYDPADRLLRQALELRRERSGIDRPDVAETLRDLGLLRYRQGEYEAARESLDEAAHILRASPNGTAPELAVVLGLLGQTYRQLGQYELALPTLERALAIQTELSGDDSPPVAEILTKLGALQVHMGGLERAERLFMRALAVYWRELEADHPLLGSALADLANVKAMQGKVDGVEAMYRRSLAIQRKVYGPVHDRVATVLNNLGHFLAESGRYDEAVPVLQEALEIDLAALGPRNPRVAATLASLGHAHLAGGRLRMARNFYRRSVSLREQALGARRFDALLFHSLVELGRAEAELGDAVAADATLERALSIWNRDPSAQDPRLALSLHYLGHWLVEQQRCTAAWPLLERVARLEKPRDPSPSSPLAAPEVLLAGCADERLDLAQPVTADAGVER